MRRSTGDWVSQLEEGRTRETIVGPPFDHFLTNLHRQVFRAAY